MDSIIAMAAASTSTLFGNVGCAVKNLILSRFPKDYFQYTNVSTEMAFSTMRRYLGRNSKTEFRKRIPPWLVVQPTYQVPDQDSFLQGTLFTKNIDDLHLGMDNGSLFNVLSDKDNKFNLKFKINRDKIEYEVRIGVQTLHQQLDLYKAMINHMIWERPFYQEVALESVIPKTIVAYLGKLCGLDIINNEEVIPAFLHHLNKCSLYPITYKMRNASATDEYFVYYMHNVILTFTDLSIESGNKKNMVDDYYELTFRVSAEFNLPGMYMIGGEKELAREIKTELEVINPYNKYNSDYIPLFTLSSLWELYPPEKNNKNLYGHTIFHTVSDKNKEDKIDLSYIFEEIQLKAIKEYIRYNPKDVLFDIYIMKNDTQLEIKKDFIFDNNKLEVTIFNCDDTSTYRLMVYVNNNKLNEVVGYLIENDKIKDKKK